MGGSLGGLTAGLVLHGIGCDVNVFERSAAALDARGAGIAVLPDTLRYFTANRILDPDEICSSTHWIRYLWRDGSTRYEAPHRYRFSAWNTIYRALLDHFDADRYHLGAEVTGFTQDADGVTVRFARGRGTHAGRGAGGPGGPAGPAGPADLGEDRFDLLVCADGVDSAARRLLLPRVRPTYAGYVAWRGTVPEWDLSPETFALLRDAITYQVLDASHFLAYPIPNVDGAVEPGRRLMNFVWYRNVAAGDDLRALMTDNDGQHRSVSLPPGSVQASAVKEIRGAAERELAPALAEVVLRVEEPFVQVIFDITVPAMAFDRVCLIGDAAFAARPHAAAGTAKAAANAWALGEAVAASHGDVVAAVRAWEPEQLRLGRELTERTRLIGDRSQFRGDWDPGDPTFIFGLYGPDR